MNFVEWSFNDTLSINSYGIPEPTYKKIVYPDILIVPLVAFDGSLNGLGYGGGFYDRYIGNAQKKKRINNYWVRLFISKNTKITL